MTALWAGALSGLGLSIGVILIGLAVSAAKPNLAMRVQQGLPGRTTAPDRGLWPTIRRTALRIVESLGSTSSSVDRRLQLLGRPGTMSTFRLHQFIAAIAGMVGAGMALSGVLAARNAGLVLAVPVIIVGALGGAALWDQLLSARSKARQRLLNAQVPDASELLALAIGAGESVPGALDRVARVSASDLAHELRMTGAEIRLGSPSARALEELAQRNDSPALDRLCQTLITAIERGTPLAGVLHDQARDIRQASRQQLMEEGGKREIAMLVPVVFLILPTTILFALYPGLMALSIGP